MSTRPRIGITSTYNGTQRQAELWDAYTAAIYQSGGLPLILPATERYAAYAEYLDGLDGLLLSGGQDIMPLAYGQESRVGFELDWQMEPERDGFELAMARAAMERDLPVLGICRGEQLLAVACGGSLYQDMSLAPQGETPRIRHYQISPWDAPSHSVTVVSDSTLGRILGDKRIAVNSLHHQAVCDSGENLRVSARAGDGIIEAIESSAHRFVLGVQWHPERMYKTDAPSQALFAAFVDAARFARRA
jgi:putative glutamine amidotransferase